MNILQTGRTALAVIVGLLWAGTLPVTMPWTATIFALTLALWLAGGVEAWVRDATNR